MLPTYKTFLVVVIAVAVTLNPMLIDKAGAVEVIEPDQNAGKRVVQPGFQTTAQASVQPTSEDIGIVSASDRLPANFQFQTASSRITPPGVASGPSARAVAARMPARKSQAAKPSPDSFILGSRSFSIPFTIDSSAAGPVEVHLFAALAGSKSQTGSETQWNWIEVKRSGNSSAQQFEYTADSDGEFWFATWTTNASDPSARQRPATDEIQPQRKIFVDTTVPTIQLSAESDGDGRVQVLADIDDATPIDDIVLQYVTDQMKDWKTLDASRIASGNRIQFQPLGDWDQLSVQLVATDKAGNRGVANQLVRRPRIATAQPGPRYADSTLAPWSRPSPTYRRQFATSGEQVATSRPPENILPPPATPDQISNFGLNGPEKPAPKTKPSAGNTTPETLPAPTPSIDPTADLDKYRPRTLKDAFRPLSKKSQAPEKESGLKKEIVSGSQPKRTIVRRPSTPAISRVPVRYSDSERFSLDYVLEAVDARGVEAIELYGSVDEGATWKLWGRDPDRQSPFDIETREEGVFSYRIVVVGRSGLASARPLAGDLPDMVVVVDKQAPEVRISGARYGEGDRIGALVIRYDCIDANLKERPITLAFSENADGPWTTIAGGLRNDGDYVWPADPGLPRAFYLRLDAMDKAGNIGTYTLDKPIDAQGLAPRARIRGFQTLSGN
ncbi:hypothetical protein LF1_30470 [Rubripirellula obstinata]|uniref:Ser-Thr-rich glycosyl-phosphatidyl-inositol-anchored membrane family protein n=1 Tax=Rubripirellula obstinata TaxID=406547 RepID=A0A5B1CH32_9BACT|nr:hypothetical protein [Rubripirellula obstinata]KAA1260507.1 hypothetical protein LF1_30470 [Rubripirellula obstinata]